MISVIGVEIVDIDLFYHFINYYEKYVDEFSLVFHYNNKETLDSFCELVPKNKRNIQLWNEKFSDTVKTRHINSLIDLDGRASMIADHDEFIEFNEGFFDCPKNKCNEGMLVQRFNVVNDKIILSKVERNISLFDQFKYTSTSEIHSDHINKFRKPSKVCYINGNMHVCDGHHMLEGWKHPSAHIKTNVHHFKYNSHFDKNVKMALDNDNTHIIVKRELEKLNNLIKDQ